MSWEYIRSTYVLIVAFDDLIYLSLIYWRQSVSLHPNREHGNPEIKKREGPLDRLVGPVSEIGDGPH